MPTIPRPPIRIRVSLAVISGVVLLIQITATRLLSATVSYHAAFAIVALVMLALAGSAAAVYRDRILQKTVDPDLRKPRAMAVVAGPIIAATGLGYVAVSAVPWPHWFSDPAHFLAAAVGLYASFYFCGYVIAWLLATWAHDVGRVYFWDLVGAALGCLAAVPLLGAANPVQILVSCGLAVSLAALLLGPTHHRASARSGRWGAVTLAIVTALVCAAPSWVRLRSAKLQSQSTVLSEQWNHLARVTVSPEVPGTSQAIRLLEGSSSVQEAEEQVRKWIAGWAISDRWRGTVPKSLWLQLDSDAGTQILEGGGTRPLTDFDVLKWDVTAAAYWLRPSQWSRVFVIGGGGGRDFITALAFGARTVDVVELNPLVVEAVQHTFGHFSGRPYERPGVHYRLGDARSELSRSSTQYDLIQMSMIDTWAASMAGALVLTENALYTQQAFRIYLDHLSDDGILTISRWYASDRYAETARVLSLMGDTLKSAGVSDARDHIAVVVNSSVYGTGVATCIMKRTPFTAIEYEALASMARSTGFQLLWPDLSNVTVHQEMDVAAVLAGTPETLVGGRYDLSPPSDDRPFFFDTSRLLQVPTAGSATIPIIFGMLVVGILLVGDLFVLAPLRRTERLKPESERLSVRDALPEVIYFAAIGASFMAVELGVLQRYILFLGHPTYALSVVLFGLLSSTALGSLLVSRWPRLTRGAFPALLIGLVFSAFVVPPLLQTWHSWPLSARIGLAIGLIAPLGIPMGAAFPTGVRALAATGRVRLMPWLWAVNGLAGTLASVLGMFLAMKLGYTALLVAATIGYATAWAAENYFGQRSPGRATMRSN